MKDSDKSFPAAAMVFFCLLFRVKRRDRQSWKSIALKFSPSPLYLNYFGAIVYLVV